MTYHVINDTSNTTATSGEGSSYPSGEP